MLREFDQQVEKKESNRLRTARYTKKNWIPMSIFRQLQKLANIYFILIALLCFIPDSPKTPYL